MFMWFGKKGFMRGPVWFLFLIGSIAILLADVLIMIFGDSKGYINLPALIIGSVLALLYIVTYIALPKRVKPHTRVQSTSASSPAPLAAPTTIKIIRDSSMVAAIAPTIISLNGVQVATIANGGCAVIRVETSPVVLQTNAVGSKYVRYELDVPSGAYGEVHVKANVFQPKLTVWR